MAALYRSRISIIEFEKIANRRRRSYGGGRPETLAAYRLCGT
jgi:hypothetical protein